MATIVTLKKICKHCKLYIFFKSKTEIKINLLTWEILFELLGEFPGLTGSIIMVGIYYTELNKIILRYTEKGNIW